MPLYLQTLHLLFHKVKNTCTKNIVFGGKSFHGSLCRFCWKSYKLFNLTCNSLLSLMFIFSAFRFLFNTLGAKHTAKFAASILFLSATAATLFKNNIMNLRVLMCAKGKRRQSKRTASHLVSSSSSSWHFRKVSWYLAGTRGSGSSLKNCLIRAQMSKGCASCKA